MTPNHSQQDFMQSEKARQLYATLCAMVSSPLYNTRLVGQEGGPDGTPFIEKHMHYMSLHRRMDHRQYIANLKIMTRVK